MRKIRFTNHARDDVKAIRHYTQENYGSQGKLNYDLVIKQSLDDLRVDPYRLGSKERSEIGAGMRSYHTKHSRERSGTTVKLPKHMVIYYLPNEDELSISRIVHESRDVQRHIPEQHKEQARKSKYQRPKISRPTGRGNDKDKSL